MDAFSSGNSIIHISDGIIENITSENNTTFVTINYRDRTNRPQRQQSVRLVVGPQTVILDENGNPTRAKTLRTGSWSAGTGTPCLLYDCKHSTTDYSL